MTEALGSSSEINSWFEKLAELTNVGVLMFDSDNQVQFTSGLARHLLRCREGDDLASCVEPLARLVETANADCGCDDGEAPKDGDESDDVQDRFTIDADDGSHEIGAAAHAIRTDDCTGVLVLLWDHDKQNLVERDMRLASRFRNLGQLYQAMAHDLRSPVATIRLAAGVLRSVRQRGEASEPEPGSAVDTTKWIDAIDEAVTTLDQSLNLLFGELTESDGQHKDFDLRRTVESVHRLVLPQARDADIEVHFEPGPDVARVMQGTPARIRLALLNVVMNAIQAMPDGGQLHLTLEARPSASIITVRDTGQGIPASIRDRIFTK